ncbi:MAG: polyprenyl synthetase family protein [Paludibacter sp.]|nr:polyprenyl synthetase family protein [Paludibacter sp.]
MKKINELQQIITSELEQINWNKEPHGLYEPIGYVLGMGGKRIRPALTLMACNMFSDDVQPAVNSALGLEVFHNFTLLHDDIMDRADVRRGKPTVHKKWDDNTAILSGDVMQIAAYQFITRTPEKYLKQSLDLFSITAAEICEGQQYDVDFENRDDVKADEYLEMIRLKTAVLLGCALKIGAWIGGAGEEDAQELYNFGINIGLAFQLKDDLLDVYGDEATFGKKIGGDILANKKTYMLIRALDLAEGKDAEELTKWINISDKNRSEDKIKAVTSLFNKLEIKQICEDKMLFFYSKAVANLQNVSVSENNKQELRNLAENLMYRND